MLAPPLPPSRRPLRFLFFLEPFPVRRRPLDFMWLVERWGAIAGDLSARGDAVVMAVSDAVRAACPPGPRALLSPEALGCPLAVPDDVDALNAAWIRLMSDPDEPVCGAFLDALLERADPDVIVTWTVNAPLRARAERRGALVVHAELGPMRPPNPPLYYCDPRGVNGASSVQEAWAEVRGAPLSAAQERELDLFLGELLPAQPRPGEEARRAAGLDPRRRVVAAFLQVPDDSNLLAWSRVGGNGELVRLLAAGIDPDGWQLVVKPHPLAPEWRWGPLPDEARLVPPWTDPGQLVGAADVVATINSSVGFEAIALGRRVYGFGGSPYSGLGVARDLSADPGELRAALAAETGALAPEEDALRRRYLHFMLFRYLVPELEFWDAESLRGRVLRWMALRDAGNRDAAAWFLPEVGSARVRELRHEVALRSARARAGHAAQLEARAEAAERSLADAHGRLAGAEQALADAHGRLAGAEQALAGAEQALATTGRELADTAGRLAATARELADSAGRLAATEERLGAAERDLDAIRRSFGYRAAQRVKRIAGKPRRLARRLLE